MGYQEYEEMKDQFLNARYDDIKKYLKAEKEKFCQEEQAERWKRFDFKKTVVWPLVFCMGAWAMIMEYVSDVQGTILVFALAGCIIAFWISEIVKEEHREAVMDIFIYREMPRFMRQYIIDHRDEILAEAETPEEMEKLQDFIYLSLLYIYDPNSGWDIYVS